MKRRLIELLREKSFMYSDKPIFKLASGKLSNYYINCKPTTMDPEGLYLVGNLLYEVVKDWNITAAGGLTMGADPLAYALAYTSYFKKDLIKAFVIRKEPKDHGTRKLIEGPVEPGERVAILEDVITTGGSTLKAIKAAKDFGLEIAGVIALVDREEGGKENVEREGYKVISLITKTELISAEQEG
ncbi:orotate phosphoribosyltransferase [Thermosulfidibacter takaii ABI70S6]|uniref:Orotate phosphoribosyltransferase n=1 Tax=Thermosulfidibacter takaii (strain DSM 17441 / JCM 13301 / NBRC 103674 / ABI70S6) TaxID=1298851 RepID=A0A0S3QS41_THET7|nr:orotate phosphoribosyltransferase [Thermosulfidibacter takaii]BAT71141.1 orotate phosphoribosyltransferase [Thermosulfidibacter takaii ABI70S6]